jgi:outer membrane protein OmpA-like peptidoglycan-associated protein
MKNAILKVCFVVLLATPLVADFNRTSSLIDIPSARILPHLGYRVGVDGSMALDKEHAVDNFDENFHAALGLGNSFEGYLDIYTIGNFTAAVGFCHQFYEGKDLAFAWGIHHLSYSLDVSEVGHGDSVGWDDDLDYATKEDYEKPFELGSLYLVSTFSPASFCDLTTGLGRGKYVGYGPHSRYFNSNLYHEQGDDWGIGLIFGLELWASKNLSFLIDLDGRDLNVGMELRALPVEFGLAITKVEQFGMSFSPRLSASFSYVNIRKKEETLPGEIAGIVLNNDGELLASTVRLLHTERPKEVTEPGIGKFSFKGLAAGSYEIYVWAEGYTGEGKTVFIEGGDISRIEFVLEKRAPDTGDFDGKVIDMKSREPLVAQLSIEKLDVSVTSDRSGEFGFENLQPGIYDINAEVEGYEPGVYPEIIKAGQKTMVIIEMVKRGMVITLKGVKFDFNKSSLRPESYDILEEAARILKTHPEIKVELQGHTDSKGSDAYNLKLSDDRAYSVRDYLIRAHGIEASRIFATGYGERSPIADNNTEEGRALNRRVDFLILD